MPIHLPLDQMSLADKLEAMELLWTDLTKSPAQLPSPAWHEPILEERQRLAAEGKLEFLDWDMAIADLRKEVHANPAS